MRTKILTTKYTCDTYGCDYTQTVVHEEHFRSLPDGWEYKTISGCGMTNYTKTIEVCPRCLAKNTDPDV